MPVTLTLIIRADSQSAIEGELDAIAEVGLPAGQAGSGESDEAQITWDWHDDMTDADTFDPAAMLRTLQSRLTGIPLLRGRLSEEFSADVPADVVKEARESDRDMLSAFVADVRRGVAQYLRWAESDC